jgi:glucose-1-phosphate thymidylyltransferase
MKAIVLAGGQGSRLFPTTRGVSKHLLAVYDKPMIYYPLSVIMLAGIREVLLICNERDLPNFKYLLGNGDKFGISISYVVQKTSDGLPDAFLLGEKFIGDDNVSLVLGDNLFYGSNLSLKLHEASSLEKGAVVFAYEVRDPERFGVVAFDSDFNAVSIEEKPKEPKSNFAVTGLYFYDNQVVDFVKSLKPSKRGELEITDVNNFYLRKKELKVQKLGRGYTWLDTGTPESLLESSEFVKTVEQHQGFKIACLEEIAIRNGWITVDEMLAKTDECIHSSYGAYLYSFAEESRFSCASF